MVRIELDLILFNYDFTKLFHVEHNIESCNDKNDGGLISGWMKIQIRLILLLIIS